MTSHQPTFAATQSRQAKAEGSDGYLGSSLDLKSGLWVRELLASACPPEVISELARMRRSWAAAGQPATV